MRDAVASKKFVKLERHVEREYRKKGYSKKRARYIGKAGGWEGRKGAKRGVCMITKKDVEECIETLNKKAGEAHSKHSRKMLFSGGYDQATATKTEIANHNFQLGKEDGLDEAKNYLKSNLLPKAKKKERTEERLNEA